MSEYTRIRIRRANSAEWLLANPTLELGEPGYEIDTNKIKIGNGSSVWASLDYTKIDPSSIRHPSIELPIFDGYEQKLSVNLSNNEHLNIIGSGDTNIFYDNVNKTIVVDSNSGDTFLTFSNIVDRLGYIPQRSGNYSYVGHTHQIGSISGLQLSLDSKQPTGLYATSGHTHSLTIGDGENEVIQYNSNQRLNLIGSGYTTIYFDEYTNTITINSIGNSGVVTFNGRSGTVDLNFVDITGALEYVPQPVGSYTLTGHKHSISDIIDFSFSGINKTPASSTSSGNIGDICWDNNYMYICVSNNNWKRSPLTTW
jgi:hypothetical protein